MDRPWQIEMLGGLRAVQAHADASEGARVVARFRTRKAASLLAYLAYHAHRAHPRELLVELFWPECPPEYGHNNLSRELTWLRRQLEPRGVESSEWRVESSGKERVSGVSALSTLNSQLSTIIVADRHTVQLSPAAVTTDVTAFETALQAAAQTGPGTERVRRHAAAVPLYRGELLPGSSDTWVVPERMRLEEAFLRAMEELVEARERAGDLCGALELAWRAAAVDPVRDETHADLVRLLIATGQREAAAHQCGERERFLAGEPDGQGSSSPEARSSARERRALWRLQVQAAEAAELRLQLALQTAESEALRQQLQREQGETRRLRQVLTARDAEGEWWEWPPASDERRVPAWSNAE